MADAKRDGNFVTTLLAVSSTDGITPVTLYADPTTHRLLVDSAAGSGTVTSVSVVTANGVSGSVATATTTPAITLTLGAITPSSVQISGLTASQIVGTDGSKNLVSLAVATYPSLTELSYVKGVTSAIQTQINAKGSGTVTAVSVATANGFSGSSSGGATPALTIVAGAITPTSVNGLTISTTTGTLTMTNSKTLAVTNSLTFSGTDSTTMTFPVASASIGYINIPQNSQSGAYTTVAADSGKHLLHPAADTNARTFTIDSNANVSYAIGTTITFVNQTANVLSIAITSDTMTLANTTTTGTRSLAQNGIATAIKITSTAWIISGTGLT